MKKTYYAPEVEIIILNSQQPLLVESIGAEGGSSDGGVTPGSGNPSDPGWGSDY